MDLKADGEKLLRRSGMEYTIVRPGRLTHGPALSGIPRVGQTNRHFLKGAATTRADLATVCVLAAFPHSARAPRLSSRARRPRKGAMRGRIRRSTSLMGWMRIGTVRWSDASMGWMRIGTAIRGHQKREVSILIWVRAGCELGQQDGTKRDQPLFSHRDDSRAS